MSQTKSNTAPQDLGGPLPYTTIDAAAVVASIRQSGYTEAPADWIIRAELSALIARCELQHWSLARLCERWQIGRGRAYRLMADLAGPDRKRTATGPLTDRERTALLQQFPALARRIGPQPDRDRTATGPRARSSIETETETETETLMSAKADEGEVHGIEAAGSPSPPDTGGGHWPEVNRLWKLAEGTRNLSEKVWGSKWRQRCQQFGTDEVLRAWEWRCTSQHSRAVYLREGGYGLKTFLRPDNLRDYITLSGEPESAPKRYKAGSMLETAMTWKEPEPWKH